MILRAVATNAISLWNGEEAEEEEEG